MGISLELHPFCGPARFPLGVHIFVPSSGGVPTAIGRAVGPETGPGLDHGCWQPFWRTCIGLTSPARLVNPPEDGGKERGTGSPPPQGGGGTNHFVLRQHGPRRFGMIHHVWGTSTCNAKAQKREKAKTHTGIEDANPPHHA